MEIEGKAITQRKPAGASLLTKIRIAARERIVRRWTIGRIGDFNLTCHIRLGQRDERIQPSYYWNGTRSGTKPATDRAERKNLWAAFMSRVGLSIVCRDRSILYRSCQCRQLSFRVRSRST